MSDIYRGFIAGNFKEKWSLFSGLSEILSKNIREFVKIIREFFAKIYRKDYTKWKKYREE